MEVNTKYQKLEGFKQILKNIFLLSGRAVLREIFTVIVFMALFAKSVVFIKMCEKEKTIKYIAVHLNRYNIIFLILFIAIGYLLKNNVRRWYLFILDLFWSVILVADLIYINAFRMLPSVSELKEIGSLNHEGNGFFSLFKSEYSIFFIDLIPLLIILILFLVKLRKLKERYIVNIAIFFILICFISTNLIIHTNLKTFYRLIKQKNEYSYSTKVYLDEIDKYSVLGYHVLDAYNTLNSNKELSQDEKKEIKNWISENYENNPADSYYGMFKNKNVIYLQVESLENFVLNHDINGQEITPNLNKIINNSFYFNNFYEQVNGGTSSDADLMVQASLYPIRSGSTFYLYQGTSYNTFGDILRKNNYYTSAIYSMEGSIWNWMPNMSTMGFDKIMDIKSLKDTENINLGISDKCLLNQIVPMMKKNRTPFYTDIITLSNHMPFILPDKYKELSLPDNIKSTEMGAYFNTVHYTDEAIGDFLKGLDKEGLLDNTIVVIYGDHCGVHKYYEKEVQEIKSPESWYKDYDHKIPLIIYSKGMKGQQVSTIGGQVDVMPTVLNLLGINSSYYKNTAFGRNLLNTRRSFAVLSDGTIIGNLSTDEKNHAISGLKMSDMIIKGNYFKDTVK